MHRRVEGKERDFTQYFFFPAGGGKRSSRRSESLDLEGEGDSTNTPSDLCSIAFLEGTFGPIFDFWIYQRLLIRRPYFGSKASREKQIQIQEEEEGRCFNEMKFLNLFYCSPAFHRGGGKKEILSK